jgi:hypothetical protein
MSEATPEAPAQEPTEAPAEEPKDWQAEATRLQGELSKARKWEDRAKENHAKVQEYEREKLPEAERKIAEAEARGRTAAAQEYGKRLATSEIRATAASEGADLAGVFDYLDLSRFVGDDGEPDDKAIKAFVGGLPKKGDEAPPSFDGGTRTTPAAPQGMSTLIRKAAGRA